MACSNIEGSWPGPTLVTDTGEVMTDPVLVITPRTGGGFKGLFQAAGETEFVVTCTEHGRLSRITFTRIRPDGETTVYRAIVVVVKDMVVSAGRFTRTPARGIAAAVSGDWETEKPT